MDYYNVDEKPANVSTRDHYTRGVEAWEEIVYLNSAVWGPMFGFVSFRSLIRLNLSPRSTSSTAFQT